MPSHCSEILQVVRTYEGGQNESIRLVASENLMSCDAREALQSDLNHRYLMPEDKPADIWDYPNQRYPRLIEKLAIQRSCELFGAAAADLRPLSGNNACNALFQALCKPGDIVYSVPKNCGGHFTTDIVCKKAGLVRNDIPYGSNGRVDVEAFSQMVRREVPARLIFLDASMILFPFPLKEMREAAGASTVIAYDASHTLGLIAGGCFQRPFEEGANLIQGSTHKTFFGPQKAVYLFREKSWISQAIQSEITPYFVSNSHPHHIAAYGVAVEEMLAFGPAYAARVIENTRTLARALYEHGLDVMFPEQGHTCSHQLFVKFPTAVEASRVFTDLQDTGIHVNLISVPFSSSTGFRIGCAEITRRGFTVSDVETVGELLSHVAFGTQPKEKVRSLVRDLSLARTRLSYTFETSNTRPAAALVEP